MNKILKYTLLFLAALSSVPAGAVIPPERTMADAIVTKKTAADNEDGTYTISLEAYVTGTSSMVIKPCDIALVLDFSSSMNSYSVNITTDEIKAELGSGSTLYPNVTYKVVIGGTEYYLKCFLYNSKYYYRYGSTVPTGRTGGSQYGNSSYSSLQTVGGISSDKIYYYLAANNNKSVTRLEALKIAAQQFIATVYQNSPDSSYGKYHRISIIPFSSAAQTAITLNLSDVTAGSYGDMMHTVATMSYSQGTRADLGMSLAIDEFEANGRDGIAKTVVFFTDGVPTTSGSAATDFNPQYGVDVVNYSYTLKHDYNANVYSVALFKSDYETIYIRRYLHYTSSNYPDKKFNDTPSSTDIDDDSTFFNFGSMGTGTTPDNGAEKPHDYYALSTGSDLADIFRRIAEESSKSDIELGPEAVVALDVVNSGFSLPKDSSGQIDIDNINVFTVNAVSDNADVEWEKEGGVEKLVPWTPWTTVTGKQKSDYVKINSGDVTVSSDNDYLEISGYDYAANCVTHTSDGWEGQKLVIKFNIKAENANPCGLGVYTNEFCSGIYGKNKSNKYMVLENFEYPTVNLPFIKITKDGLKNGESAIFNVTKVMGDSADSPADETHPYSATVIVSKDASVTLPFVVLKLLCSGYYKVEELSGWSWAYDTEGGDIQVKRLSTIDNTTFDSSGFVTFNFRNNTNTAGNAVDHAEAFKLNEMNTESEAAAGASGNGKSGETLN